MASNAAPSAFFALRDHALEAIPVLLSKNGGAMPKDLLKCAVLELFNYSLDDLLELTGRNDAGATWETNAYAWALATLVTNGVIRPTGKTSDVVLVGDSRFVPSRSGQSFEPRRTPRKAGTIRSATIGSGDILLDVVRKRAREAVRRAMATGLPYDSSFPSDAVEQVRRQDRKCAVTGLPFDLEYRTTGAGGTHFAPSPDRIVPELGYVTGNVRWVLWVVNRAKGEMSDEQFRRVCAALVAKREPSLAERVAEPVAGPE